MKRTLPTFVDLAILAALAIGCAVLALIFSTEVAIVAGGFVLVLIAMLLGARRTGQLAARPTAQPEQTNQPA